MNVFLVILSGILLLILSIILILWLCGTFNSKDEMFSKVNAILVAVSIVLGFAILLHTTYYIATENTKKKYENIECGG